MIGVWRTLTFAGAGAAAIMVRGAVRATAAAGARITPAVSADTAAGSSSSSRDMPTGCRISQHACHEIPRPPRSGSNSTVDSCNGAVGAVTRRAAARSAEPEMTHVCRESRCCIRVYRLCIGIQRAASV